MGINQKDELRFAVYVTIFFMTIITFIGHEIFSEKLDSGDSGVVITNYNTETKDSVKNEIYNIYVETETKDGLLVIFDMKACVNYELSYYQLQSIKMAFKDVMSISTSDEIIRSPCDFTYKVTFGKFLTNVSANQFFKSAFPNIKVSDIITDFNIQCQEKIF